MADEATEASALILAEAQRLLAGQEVSLTTTRTSAGTLLVGASVVAAVFAPIATARAHRSNLSTGGEVVALILLGVLVVVSVLIIRPFGWDGDHDLAKWIERVHDQNPATVLTTAINFAEYRFNSYKANMNGLKWRHRYLSWACVLVALQVVAWAVAVA